MTRKLRTLTGLALVLMLCGCGKPAENNANGGGGGTPVSDASQSQSAEDIARKASDGVGKVTASSAGSNGMPVIVLEESHNSRVGQIQHAVTLARLYENNGLRNIVLEGFLIGQPPIDTAWFKKAVGKDTPTDRARVAIQFLKQGEISAAEFIKLVYPDVNLLQSENAPNYNVTLTKGFAPGDYLQKISQVDSTWAEEKLKSYDPKTMMNLTGEEHLQLAKEIKQFAKDKSVSITPQEEASMDEFMTFWEKRMASNKTIADAAVGVNGGGESKVVAVNIGKFHTGGTSQLLKDATRSYAVVAPLYSPDDDPEKPQERHGDLTAEMYKSKESKKSVFSGGLSALIEKALGGAKKPEPFIPTDFFKVKGTIYADVNRITDAVLSTQSGSGGSGGGKPPYGLSGDFDNNWYSINPINIEYIDDKKKGKKAVLIPIVFKQTNYTIWVGASLGQTHESGRNAVVDILLQALQGVQQEKNTPTKEETPTGIIQTRDDVSAAFGGGSSGKEAARNVIMTNV